MKETKLLLVKHPKEDRSNKTKKNMWDIVQVIPVDDYKIYLYFVDNTIKLFDANDLITKDHFKVLQDINIFKSTCTVLNRNLAWSLDKSYDTNNCLEVDSLILYNNCLTVEEPMELFPSIKPNSLCPKCNKKFDGVYCEYCGYWIENDVNGKKANS